MSLSSIRLPPIPVYSVTNGVSTAVSYADYSYLSSSRTDSVRRKRPSGIDLLRQATAVSSTFQSRRDAPVVYKSGKTTVFTSVCSNVGIGYGGETLPDATTRIRNKLLANARGSSVNLANALGEYRQTASLFSHGAQVIAGFAKALVARNPKLLFNPRVSMPKRLSDTVLEVQYGVRPLINDINGSVSALKKVAETRPLYHKISASISDRLQKSYPSGADKLSITDLHKFTRAWAMFEFSNEALNKSLGQFGFTNPLGTLWELVPFSFVVDWWFNVGEFLGSLDNCLYIKNGIHQISTKEVYMRTGYFRGIPAVYKKIELARTAPVGLSTVAGFTYKPSASLQHILNGTALLGQFTSGNRHRF